jgi:hypothetical protein
MNTGMRYFGQAVVYSVFAVVVYYFSVAPAYVHRETGTSEIKLTFAHAANPVGECRIRSREELLKLAPNMRMARVCPRERVPVYVELDIDGENIFSATLPPTGFKDDGAARIYQRFRVATGPHTISARLRDSGRETGFDYESRRDVVLKEGQNFTVDFKAPMGGFIYE